MAHCGRALSTEWRVLTDFVGTKKAARLLARQEQRAYQQHQRHHVQQRCAPVFQDQSGVA
jgi:hypothetical protein